MTTTKNNEHKKLNAPNLRFPEFDGEWATYNIQDVLNIGNGRDYKGLNKGKIPVFGTGGYMISVDDYLYDGETTFLGRKGTINKPFYYNGKFWTVDTLFYTHSFKGITPKFTYCLFQTINWLRYNEASGVPSLSKDTIKKIKVQIPQIGEQNKITKLMFALDKRIATQNKVIDKLQSLIKGIMVNLQKRGLKNSSWGKISLCDVLTERKELNKKLYPVFSVSVSQGVINQIEYLGRSFAAKDTSKYHVAHYGDIVYTKSPTGDFPYGIVKQSYNQGNVAVSPLYGVYTPKNFSVGVFLHEYFKSNVNTYNYLHSLIQKGAKNTINITNQHFLENKIAFPLNEVDLTNISKMICSLNTKLTLMQQMQEKYKLQKQYLLRQMFI